MKVTNGNCTPYSHSLNEINAWKITHIHWFWFIWLNFHFFFFFTFTPHSFSKIEVENFSIWLFIHLWMNMCEFVERTWMGWDLRWRCRNSAEEEKTFSLRCCGVKENFNRAYIERRKIQLRTIERKMKWKDFYSA